MTIEEAIKELKDLIAFEVSEYGDENCEETLDALGMAIDSLNAQKVGEWDIRKSKISGIIFLHCSRCEWCNTHWVKYHYCPNCGARMEDENHES